MKTKTLITTAALIGACSLFAATSAIAADETITGPLDTLNGDGGIKTLDNAVIENYNQTANTTLAGKGRIENVLNTKFSTLTIASGADINIRKYETNINWTIPSNIHLNTDAKLTVNHIHLAYSASIQVEKGSVLDVETLEFANGSVPVFIDAPSSTNAGTINAGVLNIRNYSDLTIRTGVRLNLGAGGIISDGGAAGNYTLNFGGNTKFGTTESWSSALKINLIADPAKFFTTFDLSAGKTITLIGVLSDRGQLAKMGLGTLVLEGANTYSGGTRISGGTLVAGNENALGTGAITVENGGALQIATGVVLNAAEGITLETGSKLVIDLSGQIGNENFALDILTIGAGKEFKIGDTLVTADTDLSALKDFFELAGGQWESSWEYGTDGKLSLLVGAAIPEPSTFGLLAGLGALALVASRRRRSRKAA